MKIVIIGLFEFWFKTEDTTKTLNDIEAQLNQRKTTRNELEQKYENKANNISIKVLTILVFVYLYFFVRNYNMYKNKDNSTDTDLVKVVGSLLFVIGAICLLYFQVNSDDNFIGGPAF